MERLNNSQTNNGEIEVEDDQKGTKEAKVRTIRGTIKNSVRVRVEVETWTIGRQTLRKDCVYTDRTKGPMKFVNEIITEEFRKGTVG